MVALETRQPDLSLPGTSDSRRTIPLLVVIVNYRTGDLVIDCLKSLAEEIAAIPGARVEVVDNASGDNSVARLAQAIGENGWSWVTLRALSANGGFAFGNNAAIGPALTGDRPPRYVLLLNPDTYIRPGALRALLSFMEVHPDVGIAGSRIENPDGSPRRTAFQFHTILGEFSSAAKIGFIQRLLARWTIAPPVRDEPHPIDWVSGAAMLVRAEVFHAIGLLDDRYFMYYEEMDFCRRATLAGWACWYVPQSRVVHLVGQASGVTGTKRPRRRTPRYWFESRRHYYLKMHGRMYKFLADIAWTLGFACWRVRRWLLRQPDDQPPYMLRDFIAFNFLGSIPRTI